MPTPCNAILAIDLGTSGIKAALVSVEGSVLGWETEAVRTLMLEGGGAEQDLDQWWTALVNAVRRLLARQLVPVDQVSGICCTGQWSGTVAVDRTGKHLHNAIIWLDARGAPYVAEITSGPIRFDGYGIDKAWEWVRRTGGIPTHSGKDSIAHILFLRHQHREIYERTHKFLEPTDYINLRLTGQFVASAASNTLHWVTDNRDINNIHYDEHLLKLSSLEREKLPDLHQCSEVIGPILPQVAGELGLGEHVQVVLGAPDLHATAIGSGAVDDLAPHLCIGTSSWLSCHLPYKKTDLIHNMAALPAALPGKYFLVNEQELAGACLTFLRENILFPNDELGYRPLEEDLFHVLDRLVDQTPAGSNGVIFTPWLNGERTPVDDSSIRGGFHNLSLQSTRSDLVRAVYEGVALNTRWLLTYVEKFVGQRLEAINIVGGGANSPVWCQIFADVLNREIRQVEEPVASTVRGAGIMGAIGLGFMNVDSVSSRIRIAQTFEPIADHSEVHDRHFEAFLALYKSTHKIYRRLHT